MSEPIDDATVLARLELDRREMEEQRRQLKDQMAKLDAVIAIYKQRIDLLGGLSLPPPPPPPLPDVREIDNVPLKVLILRILNAKKRPLSTTEIIDALQQAGRGGTENFYNTVYTTLKRMSVSGEVTRDEGSNYWRVARSGQP